MGIKTRITDMLGCEHPIIMGGMTGSGTPELAAAVSLAGGLGIFPIHGAGNTNDATTEANCREWIRRCRRLCKGKPFGVQVYVCASRQSPVASPRPAASRKQTPLLRLEGTSEKIPHGLYRPYASRCGQLGDTEKLQFSGGSW